MKLSEKLCSTGIFICGLVIAYVTIAMPDKSPGIIGLVYAVVFVGSPLGLWIAIFIRRLQS